MNAQEGTILIPVQTDNADQRGECRALGDLLALIGDKWTIMVVGSLSSGPRRFNELRRHIGGISQRMLTLTLRRLEEEGLISRMVFPTTPPKVEYELTRRGHTLIEPLRALDQWVNEHRSIRSVVKEAFAPASLENSSAPMASSGKS